MIQATDSNPIIGRPHTLSGRGRVRLTGSGQIVIRLEGRGHATIRRGPNDTARFSGDGCLRHLASDRLQIAGAHGHLLIEGSDLVIEFHGGPVQAAVLGRFAVQTEGYGRLDSAAGDRLHWGRRPGHFRLEGAR
ncbi:MAG: hypothetical protein QNJ98_18430, partial [Planctomycetota bacterium]|nr:hypothetical protein [Planctomycetota bacterium]